MNNRAIQKAEKDLHREQIRQVHLIYPAVFIVLWHDYQWRENRIMSRFIAATDALKEGTKDNYSVLETLEKETGIEMSLDGVKSYHEFVYLSGDVTIKPISDHQYIYMLGRQKQWIPIVLLAGICVILHRQDKWGFERLTKFMDRVNLIRSALGEDAQAYSNYMYEITNHRPEEMWREEPK